MEAHLLKPLEPLTRSVQLPFRLEMQCFQRFRLAKLLSIKTSKQNFRIDCPFYTNFQTFFFFNQNTVKEPARRNMYKGVSAAYTVIVLSYWLLAFCGYWAFGSEVQPYIVSSLSDPKWTIIMANLFAVIQISGCFQVTREREREEEDKL